MAIFRRKSRGSDICVIGAGRFGQAVVEKLNFLKRTVILLDQNKELMQNFAAKVDDIYIVDATDVSALKAIGVQDFDTVIVTISENIEIAAALIEIGVKNIIARSTNPRHGRVLRSIGVNVIISPEVEAGEKAALIATNTNHIMYTDLITEVGNGFFIAKIEIDNNSYVDITLKKINFGQLGVSIIMVKRKNRSFLPNGNTKLKLGDVVTFIGEMDDITSVLNLVNTKIKKEILDNEIKKKDFINS